VEKLEVFGDKCVVVPASESDKILAGFLLLGNRGEIKSREKFICIQVAYLLIDFW